MGGREQCPGHLLPAGQRKHLIAEEYLETHSPGVGVFLILAAKAPASVWKVNRSARGAIASIEKKTEYVYHYSFHIMDPAWGRIVIKMSGHPPWPAQVILNGHEYVAVTAQGEGIGFVKEGNCFIEIADPQGLVRAENLVHSSDQQSCSPGHPGRDDHRLCACGSCSS